MDLGNSRVQVVGVFEFPVSPLEFLLTQLPETGIVVFHGQMVIFGGNGRLTS
ncbi:MAG: hypothetical protein D084_Lepto4C00379G0001, partial [Leptospirillum sp. Group IV 'UBA BS']